MKRKQKPGNKITQLDTIKSVRRQIGRPTMAHNPVKKEKHKWTWEDEIDLEREVDECDGIEARRHKEIRNESDMTEIGRLLELIRDDESVEVVFGKDDE